MCRRSPQPCSKPSGRTRSRATGLILPVVGLRWVDSFRTEYNAPVCGLIFSRRVRPSPRRMDSNPTVPDPIRS
jgi:hypothetical protein